METLRIDYIREKMLLLEEPSVKAVLIFGSMARGEAGERSDVDLLILHEGCEIKDAVLRRRYFYSLLHKLLGGEFEELTVIDMEFGSFIKPRQVSYMLLNIYGDALIVYDETNMLEEFLRKTREKIFESGLRRVRDGKAYYWILPKPLEKVKIVESQPVG